MTDISPEFTIRDLINYFKEKGGMDDDDCAIWVYIMVKIQSRDPGINPSDLGYQSTLYLTDILKVYAIKDRLAAAGRRLLNNDVYREHIVEKTRELLNKITKAHK